MNKQDIKWLETNDLVNFSDALSFMEKRVEKIISKEEDQLIWLIEHSPVYTAGVSAKDEDLLNKTDIPIFKTNRGGKYTYHGPKMKIAYVMIDLKKFFAPEEPDVAAFVVFLENWLINFLSKFGIKGEIKKGRVGIWVEHEGQEKKIAAIGIKLKKWVSYHGVAINIDPDLSAFENIVPCGIKEFGVTSLKEMGVDVGQDFNKILKESFEEV